MKKKYFIDMDGTLAKFHEKSNYLEKMYDRGFFLNLRAYSNMTEAVKLLLERGEEVYILSSVIDSATAIQEKQDWNRMHFGTKENLHSIYTSFNQIKADVVKNCFGELNKNYILIDDYNRNLEYWKSYGGKAVKFVNDFNDKGCVGILWNGLRIRYDTSPEELCNQLLTL